MKTKTCRRCGKKFSGTTGKNGSLYCGATCYREVRSEYYRKWNKRWKDAAYALLGNICASCGIADRRVLQIDHVHGGGSSELNQTSGHGTYYKRVVAQAKTGKYQILCANCNWIKRDTNGEL